MAMKYTSALGYSAHVIIIHRTPPKGQVQPRFKQLPASWSSLSAGASSALDMALVTSCGLRARFLCTGAQNPPRGKPKGSVAKGHRALHKALAKHAASNRRFRVASFKGAPLRCESVVTSMP